MQKILLIAVALALAAGIYYFNYYPPVAFKRQTQHALDAFADAVATKDRTKIGHALQTLISPQAKLRLEVSFFSLSRPDAPATGQDFDKQSFIAFVDNILYTLTDYDYRSDLQSFTLSPDHHTATVTWAAKVWADGVSYYGGAGINMRFSSDVECSGDVSFAGGHATLDTALCKLPLRAVPKPGEEGKIQQNPEALRQLLQQ